MDGGGYEYTDRGQTPADRREYTASSAKYYGTYYKVQIISVVNYNAGHRRYQRVFDIGTLQTEYLTQKNLYRVLIGEFFTYEEAKRALRSARNRGFERAYLVEYRDGQRYGRIR